MFEAMDAATLLDLDQLDSKALKSLVLTLHEPQMDERRIVLTEVRSMSVKVTIQEVDGVSVVGLNGRIVLGEESGALREAVKGLMSEGKKKIVLDMSNVTYIDSAGLGILVAAYVSAKTQDASIRLCALGSKFYEVLQITRLLTIFDVFDTPAAAIASFHETSAPTAAVEKA
jgi:anti-sigma B factor antagonist